MTRTIQLPDVRRILDDLERRIGILERRIRPAAPVAAATSTGQEIFFFHSGGLVLDWLPPVYLRTSSTLVGVVAALGNPGSDVTTVEVKRNGATVATLTFGGGETFTTASPSVSFAADSDSLNVAITAAGVGAEDLTVQCRFS